MSTSMCSNWELGLGKSCIRLVVCQGNLRQLTVHAGGGDVLVHAMPDVAL